MVRERHCLFSPFPLPFFSLSSPFPVLFHVSSFTLPFPSPFLFPVLFPFLFRFLFRSFSFRFPFLFLLLSFSFPFPFPFPFLSLSFSSPFPFLYFPFLYYSFSLSSLMWILWSRCDKRKKKITSGKTIWKSSGFLHTPRWIVIALGPPCPMNSFMRSCHEILGRRTEGIWGSRGSCPGRLCGWHWDVRIAADSSLFE